MMPKGGQRGRQGDLQAHSLSDGQDDGLEDPRAQIARGYGLVVGWQDREHQNSDATIAGFSSISAMPVTNNVVESLRSSESTMAASAAAVR
jgi:hypothetical protein